MEKNIDVTGKGFTVYTFDGKAETKLENFKVSVDFAKGRLIAEIDFKEQSMSLADYQTTINEFIALDKKLSVIAARKKPLSEITVKEFMQLVESV